VKKSRIQDGKDHVVISAGNADLNLIVTPKKQFILKLQRANTRETYPCVSSKLKSAETKKGSASHNLTIGEFRAGGLKTTKSSLLSPTSNS